MTTAAERLFTYAMGRPAEYYDMPTVRAIVRLMLEQQGFAFGHHFGVRGDVRADVLATTPGWGSIKLSFTTISRPTALPRSFADCQSSFRLRG